MADPTITGTGAVKRAEFKLFADVGEAESPEWELQGDRIEELSLELNPNVETVTDVTGVTATTLDKYEEQTSVEPYYAKRESKLFAWLYSVVRDKKTLTDVEKTFCCVNIFAESEGKYDAWDTKGYCSRPVLRRAAPRGYSFHTTSTGLGSAPMALRPSRPASSPLPLDRLRWRDNIWTA